MKIMVIDSNTTFRESFCEFLHSCFPSISVEDSDEKSAMQAVRSFSPDMVIMDTDLELVRAIRSGGAGLSIILMVPYKMPEYLDAAYLSGADHIFGKYSITFADINRLLGIIRTENGGNGQYAAKALDKTGAGSKTGASAGI
jgi:DNA-binding NarL/FixJ family response regulator